MTVRGIKKTVVTTTVWCYRLPDGVGGADCCPRPGVALGRSGARNQEDDDGVTWHCHYHLMYDLRTILGPDPKVYLEIGVYGGGSLAFMMQHPYETELHGVDRWCCRGRSNTRSRTSPRSTRSVER